MNRYQQEVAEMDRRHRVVVRALSFGGACCLAVLALWMVATQRLWESPSGLPAEARTGTGIADATTSSMNAQPTYNPAGGRLHLVATSPGRHASEGTAALGPDIANPRIMSAGALLENGAVLREIHSDHVVLERDGKRTTLYVEGAARPVENPELLALAHSPPAIRKPTTASPATYAEILRGAPRYAENALIGFDVYPGTRSGLFSRLGLKPGDVLTAVDGVPITTQDELSSALTDLSEGRSVVASVIRAGQPMELSLDGAALMPSASAVASAGPLLQ